MRRKILVLGGTGTLGKTLKKKKFFNKHFFPSSTKLDITNLNQLEKFIKKKGINLIINCAAIARMRVCERYKSKSFKVNVLGVKNLQTVIKKIDDRNIKLIHISSDAVYPSTIGNYSENSKLKPYNYYGRTKLLSEYSDNYPDNCKIVWSFCKYFWESHVDLPAIDLDNIKSLTED